MCHRDNRHVHTSTVWGEEDEDEEEEAIEEESVGYVIHVFEEE